MKTAVFNPSNAEFKDLKGQKIIIEDICQSIGNLIYLSVSDIGFKRIAESVYDGKDTELDEQQLLVVKGVVDTSSFFMFVKVGIGTYIDNLIEEISKNNQNS
jgi:hypothetical protein